MLLAFALLSLQYNVYAVESSVLIEGRVRLVQREHFEFEKSRQIVHKNSQRWHGKMSSPEVAKENKHQIRETKHLLKSILEQKNGLARKIFSKDGVDNTRLVEATDEFIQRQPKVALQQLVAPAFVPPPPISWYLRGIATRKVQIMINDLLDEAARIKGVSATELNIHQELSSNELKLDEITDNKERWALR
nr:chaperone protein ClpB3, chloroplastic [Tanacetum cinerariifolium]